MDEITLKTRTDIIFHILSRRDPKYPNINFFVRLVSEIKEYHKKSSNDDVFIIMTQAIHKLLENDKDDKDWKEITRGCFSYDLYERLQCYLCV